MGATTFRVSGRGDTVRDAFRNLTSEARHLYGHGGYTGTIAEKRDYVVFDAPAGIDPREWIEAIEYGDEGNALYAEHGKTLWAAHAAWDDKWGPAVAVQTKPGVWTFIGWASE